MRRGITTALAVAALMAVSGAAVASGGGFNWVEYLPAGMSPNERHRGPIPHCKKAKPKCVKVVIRRLEGAQARFGCDHRGVFATTYLVLTETFFEALRRDPELVEHRKYLYREDALFANFYFQTLRGAERGQEVPPAWEIAFETARNGEVNAAQDMLLGINAHVQSDMPFVVAALGLRARDGDSRKPDHDATNAVLEEAYQRVVDEVERRYDPLLAVTNPDGVPVDDAAGLELVRSWRERVWRNAERLANADSDSEWREIARDIHSQAADWARGVAGFQKPGERARRDAYCEAQLNP